MGQDGRRDDDDGPTGALGRGRSQVMGVEGVRRRTMGRAEGGVTSMRFGEEGG